MLLYKELTIKSFGEKTKRTTTHEDNRYMKYKMIVFAVDKPQNNDDTFG